MWLASAAVRRWVASMNFETLIIGNVIYLAADKPVLSGQHQLVNNEDGIHKSWLIRLAFELHLFALLRFCEKSVFFYQVASLYQFSDRRAAHRRPLKI